MPKAQLNLLTDTPSTRCHICAHQTPPHPPPHTHRERRVLILVAGAEPPKAPAAPHIQPPRVGDRHGVRPAGRHLHHSEALKPADQDRPQLGGAAAVADAQAAVLAAAPRPHSAACRQRQRVPAAGGDVADLRRRV
eukprot:366355-Chlamydomonas_euryale.AAC.5